MHEPEQNVLLSLTQAKRQVYRLRNSLSRLRNPSIATQKQQSKLFKDLLDVFGEIEGKRRWMQYVVALRNDIRNTQTSLARAIENQKKWHRIAKFIRKFD